MTNLSFSKAEENKYLIRIGKKKSNWKISTQSSIKYSQHDKFNS